ncbi:MAG TPA: serine/threonine-protein kinase [Gemmatimonadales bacterium]|nr:serine/threonine-protein kinase [Gemmatimonadales bacterium]
MTAGLPTDLQAALADRYELRRVLGQGGMASVYLARDRKHRRDVAIKVLLPGLAASLGAERFLKEIEIVARLTHPHILAMHDSGEAGGFLYYVMPYIEGGSLRQRLGGGGALAGPEALAITVPVADALSYAHRMGVLHRDVKPENILFSQGHPIVADFGIAKAISTAGGANLTRTGFPLGTPGYMSPEQAAGLTDLDERTDVYSLAAVVYEMVVGETPGRWPTEDAVRTGRFLDVAPRHRARLTAVGDGMEAALVRGLAVRHDQRTATPAVLVDELQGTAPPQRRRYSAPEVQAIVKRASELEATTPTTGGAMTLGGVEDLAAEVGIAPDVVRRAAQAVAPPGTAVDQVVPLEPQRPNRWIGGPTRLIIERVVDGEVPETEFQALADEIRHVLRNPGQLSQFGRSFSWTAARRGSSLRDLEVVVSVRAGRTRITITENLGPLIGAVFGGIGGGVGGGALGPIIGIGVGALHLVGAGVVAAIGVWLSATFVGARTVYYTITRRRTRELTALAARLGALARELARARPALRRPVPSPDA